MGRLILAIDEKVLLNFFTVPLIFFLISSTRAPKNKSKHRALFSECGGAYERLLWYRKKITVYSLQKSRLHHWVVVSQSVLKIVISKPAPKTWILWPSTLTLSFLPMHTVYVITCRVSAGNKELRTPFTGTKVPRCIFWIWRCLCA